MIRVVCAVIIKNGKVLITQRKPGGETGEKWEFPGGKLHDDETDCDALKREIQEELAMQITVVRPLTIIEHTYSAFTIQLVPFLCHSNNEPVLTEHQSYAWVAAENIPQYDLAAADIPIANEVITQLA